MSDIMYPEIEGHPKFVIERRNQWMIDHSDYCICYITHPWGGAWKFVSQARRQGKILVNLGKINGVRR